MKCSTNKGMSHFLSRRGGKKRTTSLKRYNKSSRNFPLRIISERGWLVAEIALKERFLVLLDPKRWTCFSCKTLRILLCISMGRSPISSKKISPESASSNFPGRLNFASVKAPFSTPKSSASKRFTGMAGILATTKGRWLFSSCSYK